MAFVVIPDAEGGESFLDPSAIVLVRDVQLLKETKVYLASGLALTVRGTAREFVKSMGLEHKPADGSS